MDYWEGGPGRENPKKNLVMKLKKKIDKLIGLRLEGLLSGHYLRTDARAGARDRLINIVATLAK